MPLNVKSILPERDYIEYKDQKIWVDANLPEEMLFDFKNMAKIDEKNFKKEEFQKVVDVISTVLKYPDDNDKELVDKMFKTISFVEKIKIIIFISNFLKGVMDDEMKQIKLDKKKIESETS